MKKNTIKLATLLALSALTIVSCQKDEEKEPANLTQTPSNPDATTFNVSENITANTTWTSGNVYTLNGRIVVEAGAELTIEPGTIIKGAQGIQANASVLVIARGAKINAVGTAESPIIFTSVEDNIQPGQLVGTSLNQNQVGKWGGLIVLGNAPISPKSANSETNIEGIPATDKNGLYGGDNAADNSGVIKYVSVRHGGVNIGADNEINGITFGGVGSGTVVENIEVVANADDGIEFFGGSVNVKNAVIWNNADDGMDTDQDWIGTVENFYVITPAGHAFELDGPEAARVNSTNFTFKNGTVIASEGALKADRLVDIDDNTNGTLENIQFLSISEGQKLEGNTIDGTASPVVYNGVYLGGVSDIASYLVEGTSISSGSSVEIGTTYGANKTAFANWAWSYSKM